MLDRYLLRYFLAVVDQGNFSRAAMACNVSQPTLSVGIAKLERFLAAQLFVRSNQRVELTEAGTRFLGHARHIEKGFNAAIQSMGVSIDRATFRVGVLNSIPSAIVAGAVADSNPGSAHRFELLYGNERELVNHLAKERIDLALTLVERGSARFLEQAIMREDYALALTVNHPLAGAQEIAPEILANEVMIVRRHCEALSDTSRFFTERGVRPHFAFRSTNDERVMDMVAAGLGLTLMPSCYVHEGVVRPRLAGFKVRRSIGWALAHDAESLLQTPVPFMRSIETRLQQFDID